MSNQWSKFSYPAVNTAPSATQSSPTTPTGDVADQVRLRAFTIGATGDGTNATGIVKFVIRDGAASTGTIIRAYAILAPATGTSSISLTDLDIRATSGNALTLEATGAGGNTTQLFVDMEGDIVPNGYPAYANKEGI